MLVSWPFVKYKYMHLNLQLFTEFFNTIQKACLPGIWSKGVAFARTSAVIQDIFSEDEISCRIQVSEHLISPKVTLWPKDEDWYCNCNDRNQVCPHVAAVVIALKQHASSGTINAMQTKTGRLSYHFTRKDGKLLFHRWLMNEKEQNELLTVSLVSFIGGISSGRIKFPMISATQEDYAIDGALQSKNQGELDHYTLHSLLKALSHCSNIQLDGQPIQVSSKSIQIQAKFLKEKTGYRLKQVEDPTITEAFANGAVLCGDLLRAVEIPHLTIQEKNLLAGNGTFFRDQDLEMVLTEILPDLEKKMKIDFSTIELPQIRSVAPHIVLNLEADATGEILYVLPILVYGEAHKNRNKNEIWTSDLVAEKALIRKLQTELQLIPGQRVQFTGEAAIDFTLRVKTWEKTGNGSEAFSAPESLLPLIELQNESFNFSFSTGTTDKKADPNRVILAWRENQNYVPLISGGWAQLPKDWLAKYGDRITELLAAQNTKKALPPYFLPELTQLCEELHQPYPEAFKNLNQFLLNENHIQEVSLPNDLTVPLRSYQHKGINWLCFLRDRKMGAMLADDMGLGKTLQALCALQGKTLIVCPTSVLNSWVTQTKQFRPTLSLCFFYGSSRQLDLSVEIVLTSYAILRLDKDILNRHHWDTIILDEAQTIKNSESQIAKAVFSLHGDFKLALSGTPIENKLQDLWSQFQFINPGLLGRLETFQDQFIIPILQGDEQTAKNLRKLIKPFILRRLKKEVAPELPPKTEKVLICELSLEEREVYDSILISTKKEVLQKLESGGSVFSALELILRLRQACCHISLVTGKVEKNSSKINLLTQTLEDSLSMGHRALVFSQWTSYLDLIEPALDFHKIKYSRLDGTTKNRGELVEQFQSDLGPQVMLISLKAGGIGLTLTAADHIFLMDPWWNPAVEDQAADRSHRIGQVNPVLIHRLVAQDTIEERILQLQQAKLAVASSILTDSNIFSSMSRTDILSLLT